LLFPEEPSTEFQSLFYTSDIDILIHPMHITVFITKICNDNCAVEDILEESGNRNCGATISHDTGFAEDLREQGSSSASIFVIGIDTDRMIGVRCMDAIFYIIW